MLWALWGCPPIPINVPLPPHEPKLVLNSVLNNEDRLVVYLSKSRGVTDTIKVNDIYVEGADVRLFEEGIEIGIFTPWDTVIWLYPQGFDSIPIQRINYQLDYVPQAGKTYRIEAKHPDFDPVWGETQLPEAPEILNPQIERDQIVDQFNFYYSSFFFSLKASQPSYIELKGEMFLSDTTLMLDERQERLTFSTSLNDPKVYAGFSIFWINEVDEKAQVFFKTERINTRLAAYDWLSWEYHFCDSIYYAYRVGFDRHNQSSFSQPDLVFPKEGEEVISNVKGGYGIVGSFFILRDSL